MIVEAVVALASGVVARSVSLIAFGLDSLIELASACVLIWRLDVELRRGRRVVEEAERTASRIGGALLFALGAYLVVAAGSRLWTRQAAEFSWPGLSVSLASVAAQIAGRRGARKSGLACRCG
jgi:divalent metal cation (Fe/Co/Zn/Cd) transporter